MARESVGRGVSEKGRGARTMTRHGVDKMEREAEVVRKALRE